MTPERPRQETFALEPATNRRLWCSTAERVLHGSVRRASVCDRRPWRRLLAGRHPARMVYEFETVGRAAALDALEAFLGSPGSFSLETAEGARIDLLATRRRALVTLECWFFDTVDGLDTVLIHRDDARRLVDAVYRTKSDAEVARVILELAARAVRTAG